MSDEELIRSAGFITKDLETGKEGVNAAGILCLGRDEVITWAFPAYRTDAYVRIENPDRYDDRDDVRTNLVESYDRLMAFGQKHLDDKFFLEGVQRVSVRDKILREMISNLLIHREYSSSYPGRMIIEKGRIIADNANKALNHGIITPQNLVPNSKNPIIAKFFQQISRADELGSGVRNLYHYLPIYSGQNPCLEEGDMFRLVLPLKKGEDANIVGPVNGPVNGPVKLLEIIKKNPGKRKSNLAAISHLSERTVKRYLEEDLKTVVEFRGAPKNGGYYAIEKGGGR